MITMIRHMSVTAGTREELRGALSRLREAAGSAESWTLYDSACAALAELGAGACAVLCGAALYSVIDKEG